jgi:cytochrome c553
VLTARRLIPLALAAGLLVPPGASAESGGQVWANAGCGGCHTLAAAGSTGSGGPDLDQLRPSLAAVAAQVEHGGGGMPPFAGSLTQAQIDAVAAYVSSVAGGTSTATAPAAALPPPAAWVRRLQRDLARLGFFHHVVTGVYGPITTVAVKRFQHTEGLHADGLWGPQSQAALKRALGARR